MRKALHILIAVSLVFAFTPVQGSTIPAKPVGLYWESYYTVGGNPMRHITDFPNPTEDPNGYINVFFLFQALPSTPAGAVVFDPTFSDASIITDIETVRARGQRVILTVGGAGAQVNIDTNAKAEAFIASIKNINVQLGGSGRTEAFDGIDWNSYEGASASGRWLTYASLALKAYYGSEFQITSPPAVHGQSCPSGQACLDRLVLAEMHAGGVTTTPFAYSGTALDWFSPQFYDGGGNNVCSTVASTIDFYDNTVTVPLNNGNVTASVAIPRSKIGIGYRIDAVSTSWTTANAAACYTTMKGVSADTRGGFNFSAGNNPSDSFATAVAPTILEAEGGGDESTITTVSRANNILLTSLTHKNGILLTNVTQLNGKE